MYSINVSYSKLDLYENLLSNKRLLLSFVEMSQIKRKVK